MMIRCIIDTNVVASANKAIITNPSDDIYKYPELLKNCIELIYEIMNKGIYVVLDQDNEIINEYNRIKTDNDYPGVGNEFIKWLYINQWRFPDSERVKLHKTEDSYKEFPQEMDEIDVDPDDKKFFAVSYMHPSKPDIFQAVDTAWWKWVDAASKCGITIRFLDEQYMIDHN